MNKILNLLAVDFVRKYFKKYILPLYPEFLDIKDIVIVPFKKMIWNTTYHVVISYQVTFINKFGQKETRLIVCTAHKREKRKNVFLALNYLWSQGMQKANKIDLPRPLFYSQFYHGTFYEGLEGNNLSDYIKKNDRTTIEKMIIQSASLFARLHNLPANENTNFNPRNSHIKTVIPGVVTIKKEMSRLYQGEFDTDIKRIYDFFIAQEKKYHAKIKKMTLIHGDAHTENIINTGEGRIGLIDFTDVCLGDFARDLGTFMQQLEYKIIVKLQDQAWAEKMKQLFLNTYLHQEKLKLDTELQARINLYYNWTAMRTAIFLFMKHNSNPNNGRRLLLEVKKNLNI